MGFVAAKFELPDADRVTLESWVRSHSDPRDRHRPIYVIGMARNPHVALAHQRNHLVLDVTVAVGRCPSAGAQFDSLLDEAAKQRESRTCVRDACLLT